MAGTCFVLLDVFLVLIAVFLPPIPVFIKAGICSADALINIALCCLGYIPGVIHAWYIIAKYPETVEVDIERQDGDQRGYFVRPVYIAVGHGHDHCHGNNSGNSTGGGSANNSQAPYSDEQRLTQPNDRPSQEYGTLPQGPPPDYKQ